MFSFMFSFSDLHSECVDIVSSAYISIHIPHYVSHIGGGICCGGLIYARMSLLTLRKQCSKCIHGMIIAWFIIFLYCVCILFPEIMMGIISWCFYQKPESLLCQFEISIMLTNFTFFSLWCWSVVYPEVYLVMFSLYCYMWRSKLCLGTQPA